MYQNSLAYVKKKFNETIQRVLGVEVQPESEQMEDDAAGEEAASAEKVEDEQQEVNQAEAT